MCYADLNATCHEKNIYAKGIGALRIVFHF